MKFLVTGANGFLGRGITKKLLDDGHCVIATDIETSLVDSRAIRINSNFTEIESPYVFFQKPDRLVHLAWRNGFDHNADTHLEDLTMHYTFLEKMVKEGMTDLTIMGSMHEIGFYEGCIKSCTPCNPLNLYGIAKNALRQAMSLLSQKYDFNYKWLRGFYIVSNESIGNSIFSKIIKAIENKQTEFPFTSGKNQYDFLDYEEFCTQVVATVVQNDYYGVINICSGEPIRLSERVESFISDQEYNLTLRYGKYPDRLYDSKAIWGDNKIIQKIMEKYYDKKN